jgi:hypothetical protein
MFLKALVWSACGHKASTAETRSKKLASGDIVKKESFSNSAATLWFAVSDGVLRVAAFIISLSS